MSELKMLRLVVPLLLVGTICLVGCAKKNEAIAMRTAYEAEGWAFHENVGVPIEDGKFMASISTDGMATDASVTAIGVDDAKRVEKKYGSESTLFLVAGFQSPTSARSYCMVFKRPRPAGEKWWSIWMAGGKTPVEEIVLGPGEHKTLHVQGSGVVYIGILVREALAMKRGLEENAGVYLTQSGSGKHIGTYHSASVAFDLTSEREFTIENRSSVRSDVVVYLDPAQ